MSGRHSSDISPVSDAEPKSRTCAFDKDLALRFPSHARARFQSLRVRRRCKVSSLESKCSRSTVHIPCRSLTTLNQRPPLIPYALPASAHGYSLLGPISCVLAAWHCFNLCRQSWKLGEPETLTCRFCRAEESVFFEPSGCLAIAWYHLGWLILLQTPSTYSTLRVIAATINQSINRLIRLCLKHAPRASFRVVSFHSLASVFGGGTLNCLTTNRYNH